MVAEDDVDMETLQAQIDMSMSFAHNLITSWIKPTHLAQLRSGGTNTTQILEEELRRPPRLGVGAVVPTAPPLGQEAPKLKRRLGKNGTNNDDDTKSQLQDSLNSDDEEYKGRPAKRKTKVDPFGHEVSKKKKRRADPEANRYPSVENAPKHLVPLRKNPTFWERQDHDSLTGNGKQRIESGDRRSCVAEEWPSTIPTALTVPLLSELSPGTHVPVPGKITPVSDRMDTNSIPTPDKAKPLGIPLLNLDGPPEPGDVNNSRRKRKRRKKKKTQTIVGIGNSPH